jgi:hypothetical protein
MQKKFFEIIRKLREKCPPGKIRGRQLYKWKIHGPMGVT